VKLRWRNAILLFFVGLLLQFCAGPARGIPPPADPQQQTDSSSSSKQTYVVTGTVVDSVRGEGIRGALVAISGEAQDATLTDAGGKFRFEGLASNRVTVAAKKPGYFNEQDMLHYSMFVVGQSGFRPTQAARAITDPVTIKLVAEGIIGGRVTGYRNEPIESLPVVVSMIGIFDGRKTSVVIGKAVTDEDGGFRVSGLVPANYVVAVGPGPARAARDSGQGAKGYEGYPVVYYPAASDQDGAVPISVEAGSHTEVNFSIPLQPFFRVSGVVSGYGPGQQAHVLFGAATTTGNEGIMPCDPTTGAFVSSWIPGGRYVLRTFVSGPSEFPLTASELLTVDQNISDVHVQVHPALEIPINIRVDTPKSADSGDHNYLTVLLMPKGTQETAVGAAEIEGVNTRRGALSRVEAGSYRATFVAPEPWYVQSALYGTQDLLRDDLIAGIGGGNRTIEISVRNDGAVLSGTATAEGRPVRSSVLIVPEETPSQLRKIVTNADGTFHAGGLMPGTYQIIAFDNADSLEYRNPAALADYMMKAQTVRLSTNQTATVNLEILKRGN
jgi:Carboxypeptidase regulatory-like domain